MNESSPGPVLRPEPPPVWPYIVPLAGFLALTALEGRAGSWYPLAYAAKLAVVAGLLWACRGIFRDLRPLPSVGSSAISVLLGLAVAAAWVGLDGRYPELPFQGGKRTAFDPYTLTGIARYAFLSVRMIGLVLVVPVIEELFYRSFLMRWMFNPDLSKVPIGVVTPLTLAVTSGVFALSHPEWLPALLTGLAWGGLVRWSRSVSACVVSHATANLALGVYVLTYRAWSFW
jgi:CAAX prenyl protease-like protein